jgi:para-aminobenzoate synthetase component I
LSFYLNNLTKPVLKHTHPTNCIFAVSDFEDAKRKVLNWIQQFGTFCFLDNHQYQIHPHSVECLAGAGIKNSISCNAGKALDELQAFRNIHPGWLFGHLGYDLKNEMEKLSSNHPDPIGFPDLYFFQPEIVIRIQDKKMIIEADNPEAVHHEIQQYVRSEKPLRKTVSVRERITRNEYIDIIQHLRQHILRGDCYEINFCQEFYSENAYIDPVSIYKKLTAVSPNPFCALYRVGDRWLLCASPERFLKKQGERILSQPIKGTSPRITGNKVDDDEQRKELHDSAKERSENVMVVDLVRNDLSKVCVEGTVHVDELYGIYSFPQVHQMISTVSGELRKDRNFADIIRATFPMGSMTGAPKKMVMELIERYEKTRRGIFSGAVGYISPGDDFDFNVVIRSIMYNSTSRYLSFQAGSGITFYSDPAKEWEECILKAEAMKFVLQSAD